MKLAESLSSISKKLSEVKESIQKLGEISKESNTPQLATENARNDITIENEQLHTGVISDTLLENTLNNMKNSS